MRNVVCEKPYINSRERREKDYSPVDGPKTEPTVDRSNAKKAIDRKQTKDTCYTADRKHTERRPANAVQ